MGWSGSLSADSAVGSAITYTPDTSSEGAYTVGTFTAPKKGVYCFQLRGSGGTYNGYHSDGVSAAGGTGGFTTGYIVLEKGQTVYIGAGGSCSAAFVAKAYGAALKDVAAANLYFVAGAGGGGGANWGQQWNMKAGPGGEGGGMTGLAGWDPHGNRAGGSGGTQSSGFAYGYGGGGGYSNSNNTSFHAGRGGDGFYGGCGASSFNGGGGGSGYIHTASVTVGSKTYTNATQQGGGAGSNSNGSVVVIYYARAELPVIFNGTTLERLIFNGVEIESLIYDGVKLFMRRLRECLNLAEPVFA